MDFLQKFEKKICFQEEFCTLKTKKPPQMERFVYNRGVLGVQPLGEGVAEDRIAGWSEGETSPSSIL